MAQTRTRSKRLFKLRCDPLIQLFLLCLPSELRSRIYSYVLQLRSYGIKDDQCLPTSTRVITAHVAEHSECHFRSSRTKPTFDLQGQSPLSIFKDKAHFRSSRTKLTFDLQGKSPPLLFPSLTCLLVTTVTPASHADPQPCSAPVNSRAGSSVRCAHSDTIQNCGAGRGEQS